MSASRILLVEDDAVIGDLVRRNFQVRGYEVCLVTDAHSALAHLQATPVDLVILDINLPDQSGWDVLRIALQRGWLRPQLSRVVAGEEGAALATLPVVVLSAVRVSLARLHEFHPLAYLPKPFPMDALLRLAAEAAGQQGGRPVACVARQDPESAQALRLDGWPSG
jgi:CheY-like chemotaxis protein